MKAKSSDALDARQPDTLHAAAERGDVAAIELLLDRGARIEEHNTDGMTALHLAARTGHAEAVAELLRRGAKVTAADSKGWTALHFSALEGHAPVMEALLTRGANVRATVMNGWTALHYAAVAGHVAAIIMLLTHNANIDQSDPDGRTALHFASERGNRAAVEVLLGKRADTNVIARKDGTALHLAAKGGHADVVELLLRNGADVHLVPNGLNALDLARGERKDEIVNLITEYRSRAPVRPGAIADALPAIASGGALPEYGAIVARPARIVPRSNLHNAAKEGNVTNVKLLLDSGEDINQVNSEGWTALHWAIARGHVPVVDLLLRRGIDITQDRLHATVIDFARSYNRANPHIAEAIVGLIAERWTQVEAEAERARVAANLALRAKEEADRSSDLRAAAERGNADAIGPLLCRGAQINERGADDLTALHIAVRRGHRGFVEELLKRGADVNQTGEGWTALHRAVYGADVDMVRLLLYYSADATKVPTGGWGKGETALHCAAVGGYAEVVRLLLDRGADVNQVANGRTALHAAVLGNHVASVNLILNKNPNINQVDVEGRTALRCAAERRHDRIVSLFVKHGAKSDDPVVKTVVRELAIREGAKKGALIGGALGGAAAAMAWVRVPAARSIVIVGGLAVAGAVAGTAVGRLVGAPSAATARAGDATQTHSATVSATPLAWPPYAGVYPSADQDDKTALSSFDDVHDDAVVSFLSCVSGVIEGVHLITSQVKDQLTSQLMQLIEASVTITTPEAETDSDVALRFTLIEMLDQLASIVAFMPSHPGSPPEPDDGGFGGGGSGDGRAGGDESSQSLLVGVSSVSNTTFNGTDIAQTLGY